MIHNSDGSKEFPEGGVVDGVNTYAHKSTNSKSNAKAFAKEV